VRRDLDLQKGWAASTSSPRSSARRKVWSRRSTPWDGGERQGTGVPGRQTVAELV